MKYLMVTLQQEASPQEEQQLLDSIRRLGGKAFENVVPVVELGNAMSEEEFASIKAAKEGGWEEHDYSQMIQRLVDEVGRLRLTELLLSKTSLDHIRDKKELRLEIAGLQNQLAQVDHNSRFTDVRFVVENLVGKSSRLWFHVKIDGVEFRVMLASHDTKVIEELRDGKKRFAGSGRYVDVATETV